MATVLAYPSSVETLVMRLKPGQDLKGSLVQVALESQLQAAFVIACVGSLTRAAIRHANAEEASIYEGHFEIVSLTGTLSQLRTHLHISIADKEGRVFGGHLMDRSLIYTTAEIVLGIAKDLTFAGATDKESGFVELDIQPGKR